MRTPRELAKDLVGIGDSTGDVFEAVFIERDAEWRRLVEEAQIELDMVASERDRLKGDLDDVAAETDRLKGELRKLKGELAEARRLTVERGDKLTLAIDSVLALRARDARQEALRDALRITSDHCTCDWHEPGKSCPAADAIRALMEPKP